MVVVVTAMALSGCTPGERKDGTAERIQITDTHVFLSPEGEPSRYQLKPLVYPVETASQKVYFRLKDNTDREYLDVSADGVLQAHKLKQDEEGNNVDIFVRIISAENSDVTLEIKVTIESVEVERIAFNPNTINVGLFSSGVTLEPIFYPAHAIIGRNLIYKSLNEKIATVDSNGHVSPVSVGQCSIWVNTPKQGAFDTPKESHITINVVYASMAEGYRLDLVSDRATLTQIYGQPEDISFVLSQLDPFTDPHPSITWFLDSSAINGVGVKDSKILTYNPTTLPVGEYNIKAVLNNIFETTKPFVSDTIKIYAPLTSINANILRNEKKEFKVGDLLRVQITYANDMYPPEAYNWVITKPSGEVVKYSLAPEDRVSGAEPLGDLQYKLEETGSYYVQAEAIVKGQPSGVYSEKISIDVDKKPELTDITGAYFDGSIIDGQLYSTLIWNALPYAQNYEAEIVLGEDFYKEIERRYGVTSAAKERVLPLNEVSGYFGANSLRIPNDIIDSTIEKERNHDDTMMNYPFKVRVRGNKYSLWSEVAYAGDIRAGVEYFEEVIPGINRYIANMEEYGRLLNYLVVFRPSIFESQNANYEYALDLYIPFTTDDLDKSKYPVQQNLETQETTASCIDAVKLLHSAINCYTESVEIRLDVLSAVLNGGNVNIAMGFASELEPTKTTEYVEGVDDAYKISEGPGITHYAENPRGEFATLPIDALNRTMEVATSNQLYLAVEMGYKPIPIAGSKAESIWTEVRRVLGSIISDDMTSTAKALAIYEWLSLNVTYDYKLADIADTIDDTKLYRAFYLEGVFEDHLAVCDGIAKAYGLMCSAEGIPTMKAVGRASGVAHAWNISLLDDGWYVIDATWGSKKVKSGEQTIEILDKSTFAMGYETARGSRTTYGSYPEIKKEDSTYAFELKISESYDNVLSSDGEITYHIETYVYDYVGQEGEVWVEFLIDKDYFASKGSDVSVVIEQIEDSIKSQKVKIGCVTELVEINGEAIYKIYIHYTRG